MRLRFKSALFDSHEDLTRNREGHKVYANKLILGVDADIDECTEIASPRIECKSGKIYAFTSDMSYEEIVPIASDFEEFIRAMGLLNMLFGKTLKKSL